MIIAKLDRNLAKRVPEGVFESPLLIETLLFPFGFLPGVPVGIAAD